MKKITVFKTLFIALLVMSQSLPSSQGIDQAKNYLENSTPQKNHAYKFLKEFDLQVGNRVLDIGCGDGEITNYIAKATDTGLVVGLDISEKMIDLASSTHQRDNLLFVLGNGQIPPFINQFELITSFMSFHWIDDQKKALQSFYKSLKPGGFVLITLPAPCPGRVSAAAHEVSQSENWKDFFLNKRIIKNYPNESELLKLLEDSNFQVEKIDTVDGKTHFASLDLYKAWVAPLITGIDHLSSNQKHLFAQDVMEQLIQIYPVNSDGTVTRPYQAINVIAFKPK
ncbi:MAG: putative trans-aconitate 2-methyltransferase [Chlamydiae bacterium]|nr:putative trans-aconitate 2-methyltransferase [Chlamydiota bacterium]